MMRKSNYTPLGLAADLLNRFSAHSRPIMQRKEALRDTACFHSMFYPEKEKGVNTSDANCSN